MAVNGELDSAIIERLEQHDLRYTAGRRAIVRGLRDAQRPVTLPELLLLAPDLATSSAYRNLSLLEDAGVVRRLVHHDDHARYELAEELTEHHHHLICRSCGAVRDITLDDELEDELERTFARTAHREGFELQHHAIDVYGTCADCAS